MNLACKFLICDKQKFKNFNLIRGKRLRRCASQKRHQIQAPCRSIYELSTFSGKKRESQIERGKKGAVSFGIKAIRPGAKLQIEMRLEKLTLLQ